MGSPCISAGYLMPLVGFKYGVHVFKVETTWTLRDCMAESAHTTRLEGSLVIYYLQPSSKNMYGLV